MDILPAIDLLDGQVVRLQRGDYDQKTIYALTPKDVADQYRQVGTRWIHVVDLDAARSGRLTNTHVIAGICQAVTEAGIFVQSGGGVRDRAAIDALLAAGVHRLVVGSAALKNWTWFESLLADDSIDNARLALGLDARDGRVAAEGWTEQLEQRADDFARRVSGSGLGAIVYTDIARDGMLQGVNIEATAAIVEATDVPVIASGGVHDLSDIHQCRKIGCGGVIIGKALYEGKIELTQALAAAKE